MHMSFSTICLLYHDEKIKGKIYSRTTILSPLESYDTFSWSKFSPHIFLATVFLCLHLKAARSFFRFPRKANL